jgi:hypothetical protein
LLFFFFVSLECKFLFFSFYRKALKALSYIKKYILIKKKTNG